MIPAAEFIVVEFDVHARFLRKITLAEFNERRKDEFKQAYFNHNIIVAGVFETEQEATVFIECYKNDMDRLIESFCKEQEIF
jgi:hypothetical protein